MSRKRHRPQDPWWTGGIDDSDGEPSLPVKKQNLAKDDSDDEYVPPGAGQALSKDDESDNEFDEMSLVSDQDDSHDRDTMDAMDGRSIHLGMKRSRRSDVENDLSVNYDTYQDHYPQPATKVKAHSVDHDCEELSTRASLPSVPFSPVSSVASTKTTPSISNQQASTSGMIHELDERYEVADRIHDFERAKVIQLCAEREEIEEEIERLVNRYELVTAESEKWTPRMEASRKKRDAILKAREGLEDLKQATQKATDDYEAVMESAWAA